MKGKAVQIVKPVEGHEFELDKNGLLELLTRPEVKNREVCVVSVAGAFRKGKSFLLDFFLRYLYKNYVAQKFCDNDSWLGDEDEKLEGFSWRSGAERDTVGILMWSDVFLYDHPDGGKIAILLLDTQGAFDSKSTLHNCTTIFALSTMLSSVQIYNLSGNLQEDDLQHLQLFSEYGRLALKSIDNKSFQNLQFLIRDWAFPSDAEFGAEGGRRVLRNFLATTDDMHSELRSLRKHIFSCFTNIDCFLMPHPGHCVEDAKFYGALNELRDVFKQQLKEFVPSILSAKNLVIKKINGKSVTATDIVFCFEKYTKLFGSNELPKPINILTATAQTAYQLAISSITDKYNEKMRQLTHKDAPYIQQNDLKRTHRNLKAELINEFSKQPKIGIVEIYWTYANKLDGKLTKAFAVYEGINNSKLVIAESQHVSAFTECVRSLKLSLRTIYDEPYMNSQDLQNKLLSAQKAALKTFDSQPRNGGYEIFRKVRKQLIAEMEHIFCVYKNENEKKLVAMRDNIVMAAQIANKEYDMEMKFNTRELLSMSNLSSSHEQIKSEVLKKFSTQCNNLLKDDFKKRYKDLERDIERKYYGFKIMNENNEINLRHSFSEAKQRYRRRMGTTCNGKYVNPATLSEIHTKTTELVLKKFRAENNAYWSSVCDTYVEKLQESCNNMFATFEGENQKILGEAEEYYYNSKACEIKDFKDVMNRFDLNTKKEDLKRELWNMHDEKLASYYAEKNLFGDVKVRDEIGVELHNEISALIESKLTAKKDASLWSKSYSHYKKIPKYWNQLSLTFFIFRLLAYNRK